MNLYCLQPDNHPHLYRVITSSLRPPSTRQSWYFASFGPFERPFAHQSPPSPLFYPHSMLNPPRVAALPIELSFNPAEVALFYPFFCLLM
jgi:hypothetical protein